MPSLWLLPVYVFKLLSRLSDSCLMGEVGNVWSEERTFRDDLWMPCRLYIHDVRTPIFSDFGKLISKPLYRAVRTLLPCITVVCIKRCLLERFGCGLGSSFRIRLDHLWADHCEDMEGTTGSCNYGNQNTSDLVDSQRW